MMTVVHIVNTNLYTLILDLSAEIKVRIIRQGVYLNKITTGTPLVDKQKVWVGVGGKGVRAADCFPVLRLLGS